MKNKQTLGFILIGIMVLATIIVVAAIMMSGQKETYYGYMKDNTTAEKVVSESEKTVEKDVKIPTDSDFQPKKGDFVKLVTNKGDKDDYVKKEVVSHDDVPHGLMMKIHEMHH
ncbi:DUF4889 domain-containing protein [Staphylococcus ratti]|uniref:DUF4889 domain-containing protein n=1 Tax=Staphylococcus ratti TaxID=2892440 RepID=A0ABY3PDT1_9STAP|nr:DUF4889 domain-containing protein [Staphylococcus ratti]UEX90462.1 DUF4889 domain-containing protein [Staphylococcus ratti]